MKTQLNLTRRTWLTGFFGLAAGLLANPLGAKTKFKSVPLQYIAALGPEGATSGTNAETWGYWREDPGPIGVWLRLYKMLAKAGNVAPAGWKFDIDDWWLDENGLIMKAPEFPMPAGQYLVTNGEDLAAELTIEGPDADGRQAWSLSHGRVLKDVTHGPCRSARYTPEGESGTCSPAKADQSVFPLAPAEPPPPVAGCKRKQYAVLIVFALPVES